MLLVKCISPRRLAGSRRASAAVELAVCLPMLMIVAMGTLEITDLMYLRERLKTAAFEGARKGTATSQTAASATAAATSVLTQRGITSGSVSVSPAGLSSTTAKGTEVTVTVSAPMGSNSYMKPYLLSGVVTNVSTSVTMIRQ
jgi:Flp pilus assembly protein TadG